MHILLSGGTGFIGRHLVPLLQDKGHAVTVLSRRPAAAQKLLGPAVSCIDSADALPADARIDAIINLAGAPIIGLPWTATRRRRILQSRIGTTAALVRLTERLQHKPQVLISGSAIGYYGIGAEAVDEDSAAAPIFQSQLCVQWEEAALPATRQGVRVCLLRTGVVLGRSGGALAQFALPIRLYAGTVLGSGRQWISWIHTDDMLGLILLALEDTALSGPLNCTAPAPATHLEFMQTLARLLHRPLWFRVPAFMLRLLLGEMAQLLVDGQKVLPTKALQQGYRFRFAALEQALQDLL